MPSTELSIASQARRLALTLACLAGWVHAGAAQPSEVVIGQTLSLTGSSAGIALDLQRGRQACVDYVNAQGGIRGLRLRLVTRDDRSDPGRAVKMVQELVTQANVVVLFGAMGPAVNAALLEWAAKEGVAVVAPQGGDIETRTRNAETAWFLTANQSIEAQRLAAHVASLDLRRIVIVHGTDRAGRAALAALEEGLGVSSVSAVAIVAVRPDGTDATSAAQAVARSNAQAVILATSGHATAAVLQALTVPQPRATALLQIYGLSSAASQSELKGIGHRAHGFVMSQVMPLPGDRRVPVVQKFHTAMRGTAGERTFAELEGCIAPLLLAEVLRRKPSAALTRAGIVSALRTTTRVDLGGFEIDLSDRTEPGSRYVDIVYVGPDGRIAR